MPSAPIVACSGSQARSRMSTRSSRASHIGTYSKFPTSRSPSSSRLMTCNALRMNASVSPGASWYAATMRSIGFIRSMPMPTQSPGSSTSASAPRNADRSSL